MRIIIHQTCSICATGSFTSLNMLNFEIKNSLGASSLRMTLVNVVEMMSCTTCKAKGSIGYGKHMGFINHGMVGTRPFPHDMELHHAYLKLGGVCFLDE